MNNFKKIIIGSALLLIAVSSFGFSAFPLGCNFFNSSKCALSITFSGDLDPAPEEEIDPSFNFQNPELLTCLTILHTS